MESGQASSAKVTDTTAVRDLCREFSRQIKTHKQAVFFNKGLITLALPAAVALFVIGRQLPPAYSLSGGASGATRWVSALLMLCAVMAAIVVYSEINKGLSARRLSLTAIRHRLKQQVVESLAVGLTYHQRPAFPERLYLNSGLFPSSGYDRASAEDGVSGVYHGARFELCEIHTERQVSDTRQKQTFLLKGFGYLVFGLFMFIAMRLLRTVRSHTGRDANGERYETLYRGCLFETTGLRTHHGHTLVLQDKLEKRVGGLARFAQRLRPSQLGSGRQLIELEDPDFEQCFYVESTDPIQARMVLTPVVMRQLVQLDAQCPDGVDLCFIGDRILVAVTRKTNFLDDVIDTDKIPRSVSRMRRELQSLLAIIDALQLGDDSERESGRHSDYHGNKAA